MNDFIFLVHSNIAEAGDFHQVITTKLVSSMFIIFLIIGVSDMSRKAGPLEKK